jgi:hypothetical protein
VVDCQDRFEDTLEDALEDALEDTLEDRSCIEIADDEVQNLCIRLCNAMISMDLNWTMFM